MRFALAVLAAALLDLVVFLRIDQWFGVAALLAIGYILMASAGSGFFAGRRPAVAGAGAVLCGALIAGLAQYAPRAAYANDFGVLFGWELQLVTAVIPYSIGGAIAGQIGGGLRRRVVSAPRRPEAKATKP